jgi:hypothetical protein
MEVIYQLQQLKIKYLLQHILFLTNFCVSEIFIFFKFTPDDDGNVI